MTAATAALVATALVVGLIAGFAIARLRRAPRAVGVEIPDPSAAPDDDTRPTLVPFRVKGDRGRSLARTDPGNGETAEERDQLDALLADLDQRKKR